MVYASLDSLYTFMSRWWWQQEQKKRDSTHVHKFDISSLQAGYKGSGVVDGLILNTFSVDEYKGYLRVATTVTEVEEEKAGDFSSVTRDTVNKVSILKSVNNSLELLSETPNLARGERIYSVRFMGDKAYVVTFKQVDPLFSIDLADPTKPKITGELKIPGFSSYMHPVADGYLLTIGRDVNSSTARVRGLKLSVFDVSDMKEPRK